MRCGEALRWMFEGGAPSAREQAALDDHLACCSSCGAALADFQVVAAKLAQWEESTVSAEAVSVAASRIVQRWSQEAVRPAAPAATVERRPERRPVRGGWPSRLPRVLVGRPALGLVAAAALAAVVLWFTAGGLGRGARLSFLDMAEAMDGVDSWYAKGTITPPPANLGPTAEPTLRIEVWFKKPDIVYARLGDGRIEVLQVGDRLTVRHKDTGRIVTADTEPIDVTGILNVNKWLRGEDIRHAPMRDLGKEMFGDRLVRTLEVDVSGFWRLIAPTEAGRSAQLRIRFDPQSMRPVHLQAPYRSSVVHLHFDYHRPFPEEVLNLGGRLN